MQYINSSLKDSELNKNNLIDKVKYNYFDKNKSDRIIETLFNNINEADKYVSKKKQGKCFNYDFNKINMVSQIPTPTVYDSHFFPKEIYNYILDNSIYYLHFNCKIKSRMVNVYFTLFEEIKKEDVFLMSKYIHMVYMWIYILNIYANDMCSKDITLYVYFTPFKKILPNNQLTIINSQHVNTGYTSGCQKSTEIVLYRKEEWFKVFIHETFHNFGLDFSMMNTYSIDKKLKETYNLNIEYKLYESYCESWGRIIYTMMYSYFSIQQKNRNSFTNFINVFQNNMIIESIFSLHQAIKILNFMDLNYEIIHNKNSECINICNHLYKEKTSVFSYYIITALIINNYIDFFNWCNDNNNILIKFKKTPSNIDSYIDFIIKSHKSKNIQKNIAIIEKYLQKDKNSNGNDSIRMTSVEIENVVM